MINYAYYKSPVGVLGVCATDRGLRAILTEKQFQLFFQTNHDLSLNPSSAILGKTMKQLDQYFAKTLKTFSLPIDLTGTPFQLRVWKALMKIPFGETLTYGEQAAIIGKPKASRAVGAANGKNPIAIVVPCHRVIGKNGSLTGYAGGIPMKEYLLKLESS